jgi:hypothetical protein
MFKSSPITTIIGIVVIIATWLQQAIGDQPIPHTGKEWLTFLVGNATGLIALFAKDFNKSNAQNPTVDAQTVPKTP